MTIERNIEIIQAYFDRAWNLGDIEVLQSIISPDYINHSPGTPNPEKGPNGLIPIVQAMRVAFPDLHFGIQDRVVSEDKAAVRSIMNGTHLGDFFGIPATGKTVSVAQFQIEHIRDGKIIAHWRQSDDLSLLKQLGQL